MGSSNSSLFPSTGIQAYKRELYWEKVKKSTVYCHEYRLYILLKAIYMLNESILYCKSFKKKKFL